MKHVIVSIHDVTPRHAERLDAIVRLFVERGIRGRYSMLVVPDFWAEWPLEAHSEFVGWLRARADEGVEIVLHGFTHRDDSKHASRLDRLRATKMTAGEGEFLGLGYDEALARLTAGKELIERLVARKVEGFVAPAWLYGEGAHAALRQLGFRFAEDQLRVWSPQSGRTLLSAPVVSYASRDRFRVASSLAWSRLSRLALRPLPITRLAIHPHDLDVPAIAREIDRTLRFTLARREPIYYRDLVASPDDAATDPAPIA